MDMINIGYSGASAAQVELNVTAQNTANAMTTGYTRRVAEISTIGASGGSPNSAGNGVQVDSIRRVSTSIRLIRYGMPPAITAITALNKGYLTQLEAVLSDDNSSLSGGFDNFSLPLTKRPPAPMIPPCASSDPAKAGALSLAHRQHAGLHRLAKHGNHQSAAGDGIANQYADQRHRQHNQQIAQAEANGDNASRAVRRPRSDGGKN